MEPAHVEHAVAGLVLAALVLTGPLGAVEPVGEPTVGEGDAEVRILSAPAEDLRLTAGRFGADVAYLRLPTLSLSVAERTGRPELLYEVRVPELDVQARERTILGPRTGDTLRIHLADEGLPATALQRDRYDGRILVRLQSFSTERTLLNRSVAVEVGR